MGETFFRAPSESAPNSSISAESTSKRKILSKRASMLLRQTFHEAQPTILMDNDVPILPPIAPTGRRYNRSRTVENLRSYDENYYSLREPSVTSRSVGNTTYTNDAVPSRSRTLESI